MTPCVSIIVPTYNVEPYLAECLDSVLGQTLHDIEVICVNDGSTDGSLGILQDYAARDERIRVIDKPNGGYGAAMNDGLDAATGEYIGIVEPDDYVALDMYARLYEAATAHGALDFVKADFYRFTRSSNGDMQLFYNHLSPNADDYGAVFDPSATPDALRFLMNTWSGIYRRDFIEAHGIRHNETPGASFQDNGFWFQTFFFGKRAMLLAAPLYRNRRDNPNSSMSNPDKLYAMNQEYDFIRDRLSPQKEQWALFESAHWLHRYINYRGTLNRVSDELKHGYTLAISREFAEALEAGAIDSSAFDAGEWRELRFLASDPEGFFQKRVLFPANEQRLLDIESSSAYRAGKALLWLPSKIKDALTR